MLTCCLCLSNFQVKILLFSFQFGLFSGPYISGTGVPITQWGNYKLSGMLDSSLNGSIWFDTSLIAMLTLDVLVLFDTSLIGIIILDGSLNGVISLDSSFIGCVLCRDCV